MNMKHEDLEESPRIQQLGQKFRNEKIRFEGYLDFALSRAIQIAGSEDDKDQIISLSASILEEELQRRKFEKEVQRSRRAGLIGSLRNWLKGN
jgi:hypothetical protein